MPALDGDAAAGATVGRVYLVGAGPGDPGLLTARALELIAAADTILYDRLIPASALDGARADAELLFVGKQGGGESVPQEQTEELMIDRAQAGRTVVRLKGGDPFVFGRGGEEALRLRAAGIPYEIVPGITSGVAAAAYAGIPVTHRGLSSAVALVTGHEDPDKDLDTAIDWPALAAFPGTLVFYMGVRALPNIARSLIEAGRSEREAVAIVERGTLPGQRTVTGTLATIADIARGEDVRVPSITLVGPVATLAKELSWLPPAPLAGLTVAVTRARAAASGLAWRLESLGARVVQGPSSAPCRCPDPHPTWRRTTSARRRAPSGWMRCSRACAPAVGMLAPWRASAWRRSARAPPMRSRGTGSWRTSSPSARSPRGSSRRSARWSRPCGAR